MVQWLRFRAPNVAELGSIPGQGTGFHMPQLKITCAATKTQHSQINKYFLKKDNVGRRNNWEVLRQFELF